MAQPLCKCGCGHRVPPKEGPGRPWSYVPEHRPDKRVREERRAPQLARVEPLRPAPAAAVGEPALVAATRRELKAVGRHESPQGLLALTLAEQIAAGGGTQSGLAALAKAYQAALDVAMKDAAPDADVIDGIFGT